MEQLKESLLKCLTEFTFTDKSVHVIDVVLAEAPWSHRQTNILLLLLLSNPGGEQVLEEQSLVSICSVQTWCIYLIPSLLCLSCLHCLWHCGDWSIFNFLCRFVIVVEPLPPSPRASPLSLPPSSLLVRRLCSSVGVGDRSLSPGSLL